MIDNTEKMRCYTELLQFSDDAIFAWRFDGGIEIWNRGAEELYGFQEAEAIGHNPHELLQTIFPCSLTEIKSLLHQCQHWEGELVQQTKEGRTVTVWAKFRLMRGEDGVERVLETNLDITERKQVEIALQNSEKKYRNIVETANEGIWIAGADLRTTYVNEKMADMLGYSREEMIGKYGRDFIEEDKDILKRVLDERQRGINKIYEFKLIRKDGSHFWVHVSAKSLLDNVGKFAGTLCLLTDITERKQAEEELRETTNYLENLIDYANAPIIVWNPDFEITRFNHAFERLSGLKADEVIGKSLDILFPESSRAESMAYIEIAINGEYWETVEIPILRTDGTTRTVLWNSANIFEKDGVTVVATIAQGQDITERKLVEENLQVKQEELAAANEELQAQTEELNTAYYEMQSQVEENRKYAEATARARDEAEQRAAELDATISSIASGVIIFDTCGQIIRINELAHNLFGYTSDDYNLPYQERIANSKLHKSVGIPYDREEAPLYRALRGEVIRDEEMMVAKIPEKPRWLSGTFAPIYDNKNKLIGVISIYTDISEQKRKAEDRLASEREWLKVTLDSLGEGVVAIDQEDRIIFINEAATNLTGYSQIEAIGEPVRKILYILDDKTSEPIENIFSPAALYQLVLVSRDLKEVRVSINSAPIKDTDGQIIGTVIVFADITEKQKIEQELLKTAKLDSLGILAGGVAHDFNNILAGILANLQLAAIKLKKHQDISKYMESTIEITRKASDLTKQLLTFAKGGDPVKKSASIAKLVKDTVQFALSGSKVKAEFALPEDLWVVDIDEGQISQVINNLTINAKQAMLTGGILEIYGENVIFETVGQHSPGQYVKLIVKDHGIGIPAEIINNIFDPFFTTKKTGNGLGLSTSYSIIKKHNGYLEVESAPGIGTIFNILLPASLSELTFKETQKEIAASGEAKILLMDDEDTIRNVGGEMLACFGYRVTLARDGQEAIELYKQAKETHEPFDVVIMDLTIPGGLGGIETMAILRQIDPEIKAVISSGYASDQVMSDYERYGFSGVVTKPYKFDELTEVLNQVIDQKQLPLDLTY
jgi:PAS domain S-box-containing protein